MKSVMNDNFKKKTWVSLGIIVGSIIIASLAFYYFSNDLSLQVNKIIADRQAVSGQNYDLNSLALLKSDEPEAEVYTAQMNQLLPDQYGIVNFNSWLTKTASTYGVMVSSAFSGSGNPTTQPTLSSAGTIGFSLSVQGPVGSIAPFLKYIESDSTGFLLTLTSFDYTNDLGEEKVNAQGILFFR
jgi:hypothetical protein